MRSMKKISKILDNRNIFAVFLLVAIILSIFGAILVREYTGYLTGILNATAGYIYEVNIDASRHTALWGGVNGMVFKNPYLTLNETMVNISVSNITRYDFSLQCLGDSGLDIYFSPKPLAEIDINRVSNISLGIIDEEYFMNRTYYPDSATNTFDSRLYVQWGSSLNIFNWGIKTYSNSGSGYSITEEYEMMPLQSYNTTCTCCDGVVNCTTCTLDFDSYNKTNFTNCVNNTETIFWGVNLNYDSLDYNGSISNYQVMLPVYLGNTTKEYYIFNDPNDYCSVDKGRVFGCVTDNSTGLALGGVLVFIGGKGVYTHNITGCYDTNASVGNTDLIGALSGYHPYFASIQIIPNTPVQHDFTLVPITDIEGPAVIVNGTVSDEDGNPLSNVDIYMGGSNDKTDNNGYYNVSLGYGRHHIIGLKTGFYPYIDVLWLNASTVVIEGSKIVRRYNFTMDAIPEDDEPETVKEEVLIPFPQFYSGIEEESPALTEIYISLSDLKRKLKQNRFLDEFITFYNLKDEPIKLFFDIEGSEIKDIVTIDHDSAIIMNKQKLDLNVLVLGSKLPGIYHGNLTVTGDYSVKIPVEITIIDDDEITPKGLFVEIESVSDYGFTGKKIDYKVELKNQLIDKIDEVRLKYYLRSIKTNETWYFLDETVKLSASLTLLKVLDLGEIKGLTNGDYILGVDAYYLDYVEKAVDIIRLYPSILEFKVFGLIPSWILLLALILGGIGYNAYKMIQKKIEKKKRFHIKVKDEKVPQGGPKSLWIGTIAETKRRAYLDMDKLTTHTIIAGSTGGGKSIAAQDIVEECLNRNVAVFVFDPTAQWTGMLRKLKDKSLLKLYPEFGMKQSDVTAFRGNIKDIRNSREKIELTQYAKPGEIQIFTTNRLDPKDYDIFIANAIHEIFHSNLKESRELEIMIVFDEIHRILPKFGGTSMGFIQIERACREFRKWGIGIMLISQVLDDMVGNIKANINTQIQMKTRDEKDLSRIKLNFGQEYIHSLIKSPVGSGLINNSAWNEGTPYFLNFRPIMHSVERLTNEEIDNYSKYNRIIEDLDYQFKQLEELKQDIFDFEIEIKLAKDKMKTGNFSMVKIYLDGLNMRIEKVWKQLGMKPKKKQTNIIDDKTLRDELEKAKAAREKYEEENQGK